MNEYVKMTVQKTQRKAAIPTFSPPPNHEGSKSLPKARAPPVHSDSSPQKRISKQSSNELTKFDVDPGIKTLRSTG